VPPGRTSILHQPTLTVAAIDEVHTATIAAATTTTLTTTATTTLALALALTTIFHGASVLEGPHVVQGGQGRSVRVPLTHVLHRGRLGRGPWSGQVPPHNGHVVLWVVLHVLTQATVVSLLLGHLLLLATIRGIPLCVGQLVMSYTQGAIVLVSHAFRGVARGWGLQAARGCTRVAAREKGGDEGETRWGVDKQGASPAGCGDKHLPS
jgi:hypothetical protein